mmetsp:Transcript_99625/g.284768  ORF Transcript_99625/g.284768 Transcript_99625/m.284768 type:complete len:195 (+) Transcript_99625:71-655(+)|eukprot:CAMPEP_0119541106 /NCGR_PEP_ID=MMETSP1344-20130328/52765_1 /TAXON_ID=236787 /ORGANISM="Florenciella parvula, Strain CCMP2471" /LENGTH=194 /DNA_ID=CAMNT_0007585029 /DNA_START=71 /DNA_END=655 /DNA_ORIENTATION=+
MRVLLNLTLATLALATASAWAPSAPMMMARKSSKASAPEPEPKKLGLPFSFGKKKAPAPAPASIPTAKRGRGTAKPAQVRGLVKGRPGAPGSAEERAAFGNKMSAFTGRAPVMKTKAPAKPLRLSSGKRGSELKAAANRIAPREQKEGRSFLTSRKRGGSAKAGSEANKKYVNKMYDQYYKSRGITPPGAEEEE